MIVCSTIRPSSGSARWHIWKNAAYRLRPLPRVLPTPPPLTQPDRVARVRFTFAKFGDARFLSHRNVMDLLERALRAAAVPVRYTEGYNPHIRLSMGPALPLGAEALAEMFDVECHGDVEAGNVKAAVEQAFAKWSKNPGVDKLINTTASASLTSSKRIEETRDKKQAVLVIGFPAQFIAD